VANKGRPARLHLAGFFEARDSATGVILRAFCVQSFEYTRLEIRMHANIKASSGRCCSSLYGRSPGIPTGHHQNPASKPGFSQDICLIGIRQEVLNVRFPWPISRSGERHHSNSPCRYALVSAAPQVDLLLTCGSRHFLHRL